MVGKRQGQNGLSVYVANDLLAKWNIKIEDKKAIEGHYLAVHPNELLEIQRRTVTECVKAVIENWFVLIQ